MNKKVCILVVMLLISGFSINISGNVSALNINVNDKIDIHNEIGDFFDNWKTKEENGVSSYQVGETLEKLKIYKDKMEDESNYDDELLLELDSEIMWLEYVLEGIINNPNRANVDTMSFPINVESEDEIVLQPNNANSDGWFEDSATAAYDADLFEDETGKVMGAGVIRTDAGYFGGKSKAWTDIWFRTLFHTNVIGTLKFEGTVIYRWLAFTIGFQNSVSTSIGGLVAYRYIYNVDDDILTSIEFKDVDSAPTLDLMFIAWGLDEESAEYSEQIASYGFDEWKTYDLGVYMSAASNAANFARNLISCSWSLEEILFEVK